MIINRNGTEPQIIEQPAQPTISPEEDPEEIYRERGERFKATFDAETLVWNRLANARLICFVLAVVGLGWGLWQQLPLFTYAGLLSAGAFFVLVIFHRRVGRRRRRAEELWKINVEAIQRMERDWNGLPLRHKVRAQPGEPYASDLDIFGHASLFQLIDTLTTYSGEETLAAWLRAPGTPEEVRQRQEAVAELAPMVDLRDELELRGRLSGGQRPNPERFLEWAESEPWMVHRPSLRWGAVVCVAAFWIFVILSALNIVSGVTWTAMIFVNLTIALTAGRFVYSLVARAAEQEAGFRHYTAAFEVICGASFNSPALKRMQATLTSDGKDAVAYAGRLNNLSAWVIPASAFLYIPVQVVTMWDVHLLAALERWQIRAGKHARAWLQTLGEFEAICALARLAHDNPTWATPDVDAAASSLEASDLGHPLLQGDRRVTNDVEVGPMGTFLLVTGSNMSGKSTLLRAIGVNIVLAGAGGPVCASALKLAPVDLWTSMRVEDSLERGVSYYMAELQRLKSVVDAAGLDRTAGQRRLFYLLDEILQGTNTAERQIAARRVILHLARQGALGAVSTHDLTLAEAPEIASIARMVHFTETLSNGQSGPAMSFDYKLRPGIATSTNALRLMQIVGLNLED